MTFMTLRQHFVIIIQSMAVQTRLPQEPKMGFLTVLKSPPF